MSIAESPFVFRLTGWFDRIEQKWESPSFLKMLAFLLVIVYLLAILFIVLRHNQLI